MRRTMVDFDSPANCFDTYQSHKKPGLKLTNALGVFIRNFTEALLELRSEGRLNKLSEGFEGEVL